MAKPKNAKKAILIDALAFSVNVSFPQFACQSSTLEAAADEADIRRYAIICKVQRRNVLVFTDAN